MPIISYAHIICASRNAWITRYIARPASLLFPHGHNLAQKPPKLVGTVLDGFKAHRFKLPSEKFHFNQMKRRGWLNISWCIHDFAIFTVLTIRWSYLANALVLHMDHWSSPLCNYKPIEVVPNHSTNRNKKKTLPVNGLIRISFMQNPYFKPCTSGDFLQK